MAGKTDSKASSSERWRQFIANFGSDPTKALTRAYILALGLIAFLTVSGHVITAHITEQQKEGAEIAYHIGRQRTLTQQIMLYASNYFRMGEQLDYDFMMQSLWDLENGHKFVVNSLMGEASFANRGQPMSPALFRVYYNPPFNLHEQVMDFKKLIKEYAELPPDDKSVGREEKRKELLDKMSYRANNALRPAMDAALEYYQTETLEEIARFYSMQLGGAIFILVVLLAEALLIFQPLINKMREYNRIMQRYALEDSLTGLNNRRAFMNAAEIEMRKARRDKTAVTVAILDLDHFKQVNDTYGHEVGDKVLQHFAGILKVTLRAGDITGRIGGEEFAIVLPKIDLKGAQMILQRLCDNVAQTPCEYEGPGGVQSVLTYTISIGFTGPVLINEEHNIDNLLSYADNGLYQAKEQGRNRVVHMA